MIRKCSFLGKYASKICSVNLLLSIVIAIYAFVFFSNFVISHIEKAQFSFTGRPRNSKQTFVIIYGTSTRAASAIGKYLNLHLDSFYFSDPFRFLPNVSCPNSLGLISNEVDWLEFYRQCNFKYMERILSKKYVKKPVECSGGIQCLAYERMGIFSDTLRCRPANTDVTMNLNHPDSSLLSVICRKSSLILLHAPKACDLESFQLFLRQVNKKRIPNVKVLHVTEDPRSLIYSFMKELNRPITPGLVKELARVSCTTMLKNLNFAKQFWHTDKKKPRKDSWSTVSTYMRFKVEELQSRPRKFIQHIKNFLGNTNSTDMKCELSAAANESDYENSRNYDTKVDIEWREILSVEEVMTIQSTCMSVFKEFSYFHVFYKEDLEDTKNLELF